MRGKTLILGASPNPERYSYKATARLASSGHEVVPLGIRQGKIQDIEIVLGKPELTNIDTVTIYLNPARQEEWYSYILNLKPRRIIFNPGAENPELSALATLKGIKTEDACTLVLLSIGKYDDERP